MASPTEAAGQKPQENSGSSSGSENTAPAQDEGKSSEDVQATAVAAAELLEADIARSQARVSALATGLREHQEALEAADARYEEVRAQADNDALRYAYSQLLNPVGLHTQSRQVDTTALGGFGSAAGVVHAADVFGSEVQKTVAGLAWRPEADPVTVLGAVPRSALVDPDSLKEAQSGSNKDSKK
jgi:hypothetical protein